jgi:hypothetical protein
MSLLEGWDNFYVILGSAAAGLMGLTFVIIALLSDRRRAHPSGMSGYITPTIVHFGTVLALSAFLSMPHQNMTSLSLGLGVTGIADHVWHRCLIDAVTFYRDTQRLGRCSIGHGAKKKG